ncbi:MAG: response regulator transcription factor [Oceanospirillaceae bacterium]|nr:response regulator transcription factor [Oceanospirillaceae bacterium]
MSKHPAPLHKGAHLLIVEDDTVVRQSIAQVLTNRGYHITQCDNGRDGLKMALRSTFQLILLDIMLPKLDGLSLLHQLREQRDTPVIMLTASGAEEERIQGLSIGADDYLAKPFNMTELILRIDAILKRSMFNQTPNEDSSTLSINDLCLNLSAKQASLQGVQLTLTPIELSLLETFMRQKLEVLTKAYLYQKVLHKAFSRYDRSLDMHISNLRGKLAQIQPQHQLIRTVHGKGYTL